jgi:hypothetical protein
MSANKVGQAFQPASSPDFPVRASSSGAANATFGMRWLDTAFSLTSQAAAARRSLPRLNVVGPVEHLSRYTLSRFSPCRQSSPHFQRILPLSGVMR